MEKVAQGKHPNSLANLDKGRRMFKANEERTREAGRKGRKGQALSHERDLNLIKLFEIAQKARVHDEKVATRLEEAGLPPTYAGQIAFNVIQKAGVNPLMLQTLLKALGMLNDNPSVTINNVNNPYQNLTEEQLNALAEKYKLKTE